MPAPHAAGFYVCVKAVRRGAKCRRRSSERQLAAQVSRVCRQAERVLVRALDTENELLDLEDRQARPPLPS